MLQRSSHVWQQSFLSARVGAGDVGGELDETAPGHPSARDGLGHEPLADLRSAVTGTDAHALELGPSHAGTAQARNDRELQAADNLVVPHRDEQLVAGLGRHVVERAEVDRRHRVLHALSLCPQHVVGEEPDDRRHVLATGDAHDHR